MLVVVLRATLQNKYINEPKMSPVTLKRKKRKKNMNSNSVKPNLRLATFVLSIQSS